MEVQNLQYAPKPAVIQRRFARRALIAFAILAVLIPSAFRLPTLWDHMQLLRWQRQAMGYALPPDQIVFTGNGQGSALKSVPGCVSRGNQSFVFAVPWDRFYQLASPPGRQATATLFLHELHNNRGESRLVIVEGTDMATVTVFRPGSTLEAPQELSSIWLPLQTGHRQNISYYAGQTDPKDPSHFTIRIVTGNDTETFHGWLKDDDNVATFIDSSAPL
jgi:hypothetical protein